MLKKALTALAICLNIRTAVAQEVNFGFISTEQSQNLRSDWQPLIDDMEKQTGLKVKAFFASDYAGIIEGMRFNKVQLAWMGNKSAMEAVDRSIANIGRWGRCAPVRRQAPACIVRYRRSAR